MLPDISVMDNFFDKKEFDILYNNLNTIKFVNIKNTYGAFGFIHDFEKNKDNEWLYNKIKNVFFPHKNLEVSKSSFRLRHNSKEVLFHVDEGCGTDYNFILYLKGKELLYNGTGFYNDSKKLDRYIGFIENRALFFRGSTIVHADLQALGESSPRYSVNIFYKYRDK